MTTPGAFQGLKWQHYFKNYVTPREWKHGSRDMPFGLGAKSLYVDGTNGDDSNDGISWKTAKKKIQSAIDIAESWTNIFISSGTYSEAVLLDVENVHLFGQQRDGVVIESIDHPALRVTGNVCSVHSLSIDVVDYIYCARIDADHCSLFDIKIDGRSTGEEDGCEDGLNLHNLTSCHLDQIFIQSPTLHFGVSVSYCDYCVIENCRLDLSYLGASTYGMYLSNSNKTVIKSNEIVEAKYGILTATAALDNNIFHNNIISATHYLYDEEGTNHWYENFIGGHTNVDNGFGIAKAPYTFTGGSDPRPTVVRNGWEFLSMGSTITNILEELELEAIHASYLFPEDTDETVTFTAGGTINTFGAWAEVVDNNAVTFSSKLASNEGHISASAIESANTNGKIYLIEIAYGAAKTIVAKHRFKSGVENDEFQLCRMRTLKIPAGETVYYRMKCETASATCEINLKYHFHP